MPGEDYSPAHFPPFLYRKMRKRAKRGRSSSSEVVEQQELSELARVAISEGHVACLRVIREYCDEQVGVSLFSGAESS